MSFLFSNLPLARCQPDDDIDELFRRLPQVEPSGELITRIVTQIRRLPGPLARRDSLELPEMPARDTLVVRNEQRDPS